MANIHKVLGQINPSTNTLTNLYVTSTSTSAIVGTITIHNLASSNASYSLIVRPNNETINAKHYIIRGGVLPGNELVSITGAVTMNADVILAATTNSNDVTFNAYGVEIV